VFSISPDRRVSSQDLLQLALVAISWLAALLSPLSALWFIVIESAEPTGSPLVQIGDSLGKEPNLADYV